MGRAWLLWALKGRKQSMRKHNGEKSGRGDVFSDPVGYNQSLGLNSKVGSKS